MGTVQLFPERLDPVDNVFVQNAHLTVRFIDPFTKAAVRFIDPRTKAAVRFIDPFAKATVRCIDQPPRLYKLLSPFFSGCQRLELQRPHSFCK